MHIAEVVTIAKSLPLLRLNTYKSLILSYSADYRRIFRKKWPFFGKSKVDDENSMKNSKKHLLFRVQNSENYQDFTNAW